MAAKKAKPVPKKPSLVYCAGGCGALVLRKGSFCSACAKKNMRRHERQQ